MRLKVGKYWLLSGRGKDISDVVVMALWIKMLSSHMDSELLRIMPGGGRGGVRYGILTSVGNNEWAKHTYTQSNINQDKSNLWIF